MLQFSVWEKETFFAPQDVIIIGSGFVGLWSALKLIEKYPHKKITILERGLIPTGASTRNAGFSCFGSPGELLNDIGSMGEQETFDLVSMRYHGVQQIQRYFSADAIGYDASGGYECFANDAADWQQVNEKLPWLNEWIQPLTGKKETFVRADEKLKTFGFSGFHHLTYTSLEGGLHSGLLIKALLHKVQSMGVQVITGVTVKGFESMAGGVRVHTEQQADFSARQLLLCTNAFTRELLPEADIIPNRGQVLVTSEIPGLAMKGCFHFDKGYYYFRNLGNRILIGGARNKAMEQENTPEFGITGVVQEELESFISRHLLSVKNYTVTDRWSGIMAMGSQKMPIVKAVEENVFCCVRMSGMGVALAPVVAGRVAELMG